MRKVLTIIAFVVALFSFCGFIWGVGLLLLSLPSDIPNLKETHDLLIITESMVASLIVLMFSSGALIILMNNKPIKQIKS